MNEAEKQFYINVGKSLKIARKQKKLTQQEVANLLGLGRSTVTQHEIGICNIPHSLINKYAKLYDISLDSLVGNVIEPKKENPFEEFSEIDFSQQEIEEIKKYIRYILSQRE